MDGGQRNWSTAWRGIDAFRTAMVDHIRVRMMERFPDDHVERVRRPSGGQWSQMQERVADRHAKGTVRRSAPDAYDILDVAHFAALFKQYFDVLAPTQERKRCDAVCKRLVECADFRHACAHPGKQDLPFENAIRGLENARGLLLDVGLNGAAEDIYSCMAELHGSPASIRRPGPTGYRRRIMFVVAAVAAAGGAAVATALLVREPSGRAGGGTAECGVSCCGGALCGPDIRTNAGAGVSRHSKCEEGRAHCEACPSGRTCVPFDCSMALPRAKPWSLRAGGVRRGGTDLPEALICIRLAAGVPPRCARKDGESLGMAETELFGATGATGLGIEVKLGEQRLGKRDGAQYDKILVAALCDGLDFKVPATDGGDDLVVTLFLDDG